MLNEFLDVVTNNIGRISPRSITESYFTKIGKRHLWEWWIEATKHLSHIDRPAHKLLFLKAGYTTCVPMCSVCGTKPVTISDGAISRVCSASCAKKDPQRAAKISESRHLCDEVSIDAKRRATMLERFGVEYNSQRPEAKSIISKLSRARLGEHVLAKLENRDWLFDQYITNGRSAVDIADELDIDYSTVLVRVRENGWDVRTTYNNSFAEKKIRQFLEQKNIKYEINYNPGWESKKDLDIFIPEHNLAIEVNGLRYHSWHPEVPQPENPKRHIQKKEMCTESKISLLQFTDKQVNGQLDIVTSIIQSKLGGNAKIGARECTKKHITPKEARLFFEANHLDGFAPAQFYIGLKYKNELVQVISLSKPRFDTNYDLEIVRFATQRGISVTGGLSRLLSDFSDKTIVTYASLDISDGASYKAVGFEEIGRTSLNYFWTTGTKILSRYQTMKSKLKDLLPVFNPNISEADNMFVNKWRRYYGCGSIKLVRQSK